jgi:transcriptional regulator with XRE-family HTH domain
MKYLDRRPRRKPTCFVDKTRPIRHPKGVDSARDFNRLADYAINRRVQLGLSRTQVAELMKMTDKTVERIELGKSVRAGTHAALEVALEWQPGSARRVLEGGEPLLIDQPAEAKGSLRERVLRDETEEALMDVTELSEDNRWTKIFQRRKRLAAEQGSQALPMRRPG